MIIAMVIVAKYLFILLLISVTSAKLAIRNVVTDVEKTYPSAAFKYFSDYEEDTLENKQVVFLEGEIACSPTRDLVHRKMVVANFEVGAVINCWPIESASLCAANGALAYVAISFYNPPGLESNLHWTFNPSAENIGIPYVEIAAVDISEADIELWRATMMEGMVATLGPPYTRIYRDLFESPSWLISIQIILPAWALLVSSHSIAEIRRRLLIYKQNSSLKNQAGLPHDRSTLVSAPLLICVVEAPTCVMIGAILALGEYGPLYLPISFHYFFVMLLTGSSFFTTLVSALMLHEKSKFVAGLPSSNDIPRFYRKTIISSALICIGSDYFIGGLTATDPRAAYGVYTFSFGIYGIGQIIVAIFFFIQAWAFYRPLLTYMSHPESQPRPENVAQIRFLIRILTLCGSAMLLNTCSMVFVAILATGEVRAETFVWLITMFLFSSSRICISYCQVSILYICSGSQKRFTFRISCFQVKIVSSNKVSPDAITRSFQLILHFSLVVIGSLRIRHNRVQDEVQPASSSISKPSIALQAHVPESSNELVIGSLPWF